MCFLLYAKNSRYFLVVYIYLVGVFTYLRVSHCFLCAVLTVAASLGVAQAQTKIKYGAYHTGSLLKAQDLYPGMSRGAGDMGVFAVMLTSIRKPVWEGLTNRRVRFSTRKSPWQPSVISLL